MFRTFLWWGSFDTLHRQNYHPEQVKSKLRSNVTFYSRFYLRYFTQNKELMSKIPIERKYDDAEFTKQKLIYTKKLRFRWIT